MNKRARYICSRLDEISPYYFKGMGAHVASVSDFFRILSLPRFRNDEFLSKINYQYKWIESKYAGLDCHDFLVNPETECLAEVPGMVVLLGKYVDALNEWDYSDTTSSSARELCCDILECGWEFGQNVNLYLVELGSLGHPDIERNYRYKTTHNLM